MTGRALEHRSLREYVELTLLAAILVMLSFTPLGFVPVGPVKATTVHIPVIIGAVMLGEKAGAILGGLFGLISMIRATFFPTVVAFAYSPFIPIPGSDRGSWKALLVAFVPRILIGLTAALLCRLLKSRGIKNAVTFAVCGVAGSVVNTVLGMGLIYVLFGSAYAQAIQVAPELLLGAILTVVLTNGVAEAILAAIVTPAVCTALTYGRNRSGTA